MNKKLFDTRMNSVNHYEQEIKNLKEAIRITESTLKDLVDSFLEFNPFKKGDILLIKDIVVKVSEVLNTYNSSEGIELCVKVYYPNSYGGYNNKTDSIYIKFNDIEKIKIIYSSTEESKVSI